jgi:hypothetical protein
VLPSIVMDRVINRFAVSGIAGMTAALSLLAVATAASRARFSRGRVALWVTSVDGNRFQVALADLAP